MMGRPIQLNSPLNMLARVQGIDNMRQTNALNAMQMQDAQAQRAAQAQAAQARQQALAQLPPPPPDAPPEWHQMHRAVVTGLASPKDYFEMVTKPQAPIAGDKPLLDPKTMQPIYTPPEKPEKPDKPPSAVQEYEYAKGQGYQGSFEQWQTNQKRAGASSVSVNTGQKGLDNTLKLRGEFKSEPIYKAHQEVQAAHSQVKEALKLESPAGDLAGATKIMKILDPGSVVRESELGMAMAASGLMDRITNYARMTLSGQKLTPTQRKDFQVGRCSIR
ncbi:MAG: hypothetical protein IPG91_19505 [Ideonella sp.]|nr:hypothetical protein [Ideonella sp.]